MTYHITIIWVIMMLSCFTTSATEWTVCSTCELTSIHQAVSVAADFDTISIEKGVYKSHDIEIDKPLTIIGKEGSVIDGETKGTVFWLKANHITVSGLKIINVGSSYIEDFAAIKSVRTRHCRIIGNTLENVFFGIVLEKTSRAEIMNNVIKSNAKDEFNSGNGIHLWYCRHIKIDNNQVNDLRDGIYLEFVDSSSITNNVSENNLRYGLHFMFSNNNEYAYNLFSNNGAGVAVMFSKHINMMYNTFTKNWGVASYGLLLKEINDAEIHHNVFNENTIGINVEGSNRISYNANEFSRNGWAVRVQGGCYANHYNYNNFLYNTFDISYNGKLNDNEFNKNYWSSYTGYDLDKDRIGDIPHRPVKLFSYVVNRTPETIILLRSLFIDLINISEKVSPVFTPDNLLDHQPLMKVYNDNN